MEVVLQRLYRLLVRQREIASGMPKREIDRKIASGGYNMPYETVKKKLDENLDFSGIS